MPLPSPKGKQKEGGFVSSCMSSEKMKKEYPDEKQRAAVCYSRWKKSKGVLEIDLINQAEEGICPECGCLPCVCGS